jgi:hypothetical protein
MARLARRRYVSVLLALLTVTAGCASEQATQPRHRVTVESSATAPPASVLGASNAESLPGGITQLVIAAPHLEGYDRDLFGGEGDVDRDCQNTRAEVLIAESRVPVTFTSSASCIVATGEWMDPWSGAIATSALALEVDHTVALANAWRSGAWAWTNERRFAFANDLTHNGHLIAIPSAENQAKADDGPDGWRPPLRTSWCAYARLWTAIKARWNLTATPAEWSAILEMAATC